MILIPALILAAAFLVLSAIHFYWAAGGRRGLDGSIPTQDGVPLFSPGKMLTLLVAAVLLGAASISLWRAGVPNIGPAWVPRTGAWVMAVALAGRATGDFRYCGFF